MLDPILFAPCHVLTKRLQDDTAVTSFDSIHGLNILDYIKKSFEFEDLIDSAMDSDSSILNLAIKDLKKVFDGVTSLVDARGKRSVFCGIIIDAFLYMQCTVLDLPHVVANLSDT